MSKEIPIIGLTIIQAIAMVAHPIIKVNTKAISQVHASIMLANGGKTLVSVTSKSKSIINPKYIKISPKALIPRVINLFAS